VACLQMCTSLDLILTGHFTVSKQNEHETPQFVENMCAAVPTGGKKEEELHTATWFIYVVVPLLHHHGYTMYLSTRPSRTASQPSDIP
jgi:hypothetical protein